jgi:hypothetical protein
MLWLDTKIICPGDRWNQPHSLLSSRLPLPGISRAQPLVIARLSLPVDISRLEAQQPSGDHGRGWPSHGFLTSPNDSKRDTRLSVMASSETGVGFARTALSTRTRSVESTRTRSEGSSNVIVISDESRSSRSIFWARLSDLAPHLYGTSSLQLLRRRSQCAPRRRRVGSAAH